MSKKIAFVGAGIATSYTLIPFLDNLENASKNTLKLFIIDKSNDFFKGMPYGNRSGKSVLLIQDLKNFISEPHRTHFKEWLNENIDALQEEFIENGGHLARKWVDKNSPIYLMGNWNDLYIPRFFFGKYISQEVLKRIEKLTKEGRLKVEYLQKETTGIVKNNDRFEIYFKDGTKLEVDKTVLSIGSLPYKKLYKKSIEDPLNSLYIKEPYGVGMEENMNRIVDFIKARKERSLDTKIAILGANASGLEMIYKICDKLPMDEFRTSFATLSSHGVMPDGTIDLEKAKSFRPLHLEGLTSANNLTAELISEAAHKDIDEAERLGIGAATSVGIISQGFGSLLPKLNKEELLNFACFHGNQIGRRQRCAGNHYLSIVEELTKRKRFKHIKGRFLSIEEENEGLDLIYKVKKNENSESQYQENFNLIINCLGSINFSSDDLGPLLKNLIEDGLCKPNPSNIGFHIDNKMQATKNLFIAGPLLAGNQIEDKIFWHLEHCIRIIWSSSVLSKNLLSSLSQNK